MIVQILTIHHILGDHQKEQLLFIMKASKKQRKALNLLQIKKEKDPIFLMKNIKKLKHFKTKI